MADQIQEAKDWLGDLSKIVSRQKTKEDYEYAKKRTDSLEWLINRVEELEENNLQLVRENNEVNDEMIEMYKDNQRYKQALEEILDARNHFYATEYVFGVEAMVWKALNQSK